MSAEVAWFGALCDDDTEFLGVAEPALASSWAHCRDIVQQAEVNGFDNVLLPSGYGLGIDATAFAAAIATHTDRIRLLLAVRIGELWLPQLARQLATIDQMCSGRLTVNVISSDLPGQPLESSARYERTAVWMAALRQLLDGNRVDVDHPALSLHLDPPRVRTVSGRCPPLYFGGFSDAAKQVAAEQADVFLTWPDAVESVAATIAEMRARAHACGRTLRFGLRTHVIVRPTVSEAREAAARLVSRLDDEIGATLRGRSLDSESVGVSRQRELRERSRDDGFVTDYLWTGIGRARSGAGAAIVGDADKVVAALAAYREVGVDAFILSGYTHLAECDWFARLVLPRRGEWAQ